MPHWLASFWLGGWWGWLKEDEGNFALGATLVAGVVLVPGRYLWPHFGALIGRCDSGNHRARASTFVVDLDVRIVPQVVEPGWVLIVAAARRNDHETLTYLKWRGQHDFACLPTLATGRREL